MEISNNDSKVTLEKEQLVSENINYKSKTKEKKYQTILYSDIKELKIVSFNVVQYILYVLGLIFISYGFAKKEHTELGVIYLDVPPTLQEKVIYSIIGLCIISFGIYFQKKYGKLKGLTVKHFEGKIKNTQIFTSPDLDEVNQLKNEIEKRITKT